MSQMEHPAADSAIVAIASRDSRFIAPKGTASQSTAPSVSGGTHGVSVWRRRVVVLVLGIAEVWTVATGDRLNRMPAQADLREERLMVPTILRAGGPRRFNHSAGDQPTMTVGFSSTSALTDREMKQFCSAFCRTRSAFDTAASSPTVSVASTVMRVNSYPPSVFSSTP